MTKPVYSLPRIIDRIDSGAWWSTGGSITYAMPDSRPFTSDEGRGFQQLTGHMKGMAAEAFELWDDVINVDLDRVGSGGNIFFGMSSTTDGGGTYSQQHYGTFDGARWVLDSAHVWLNSEWDSHDRNSDITYGSYGFMTYIHEIGHALGLDHPGDYNGSADYRRDAVYQQDTHRYTVMSYFYADEDGSRTDHHGRSGEWMLPSTPMVHDIAAIQSIYGADMTTRAGSTTYGFHANAGSGVYDFAENADPVFAIWDAGGIDMLDASSYRSDQRIDLGEGAYSSIGGMTNNIGIAFDVVIENARGGSGDDRIAGNGAGNLLYGRTGSDRLSGASGNDNLYGQGGADQLQGGNGDDRLYGGDGNDRLEGDAGSDWFSGGGGDDCIRGGTGIDTVKLDGNRADYRLRDHGSYVEVIDRNGDSGSDCLYSIEQAVFDDGTVML